MVFCFLKKIHIVLISSPTSTSNFTKFIDKENQNLHLRGYEHLSVRNPDVKHLSLLHLVLFVISMASESVVRSREEDDVL